MNENATDFFTLMGYVQDDLRQTQARLVQLRALAASMNFPDASVHLCGECGLDRATADRLEDHLRNVHGRDVCDGEKRARQAPEPRARKSERDAL